MMVFTTAGPTALDMEQPETWPDPTLGSTVVYTDVSEMAAVVVGSEEPGTVNLQVLNTSTDGSVLVKGVPPGYDDGCWHWPHKAGHDPFGE
jgi:hypothetical protein